MHKSIAPLGIQIDGLQNHTQNFEAQVPTYLVILHWKVDTFQVFISKIDELWNPLLTEPLQIKVKYSLIPI